MAKENLLTYLDKSLETSITNVDTAIDWDKKNHTVELLVRLFAENKSSEATVDIEGIESEAEILEVEDGVLLYNPSKSNFEEDYYLTTIAYEEKKGMTKGKADAIIQTLKEVLDDGISDLLDYANDDSVEEFSLKWDQDKFLQLVQEYEAKQGGLEYLSYPRY